jgi:hypothetical protein
LADKEQQGTMDRVMRRHSIACALLARRSAVALALLLAPTFAAAAAPAEQQGADWGRYRDRDFGMSFDFPRHIFPLQSAVQGGPGVTFSTTDGRARIRVFAARNESRDTPARYLARIRNDGEGRFTYVRTTRRFFVASGVRAGAIFYRRCNFVAGSDRLSCFQIDYPKDEKRAWDRIVTRISLSLRAAAE